MSGSPSPVPVVVTHLPGTDCWPNLLQGSVGSVVGTLLAVGGTRRNSRRFWAARRAQTADNNSRTIVHATVTVQSLTTSALAVRR
jgi:hypothetical protein